MFRVQGDTQVDLFGMRMTTSITLRSAVTAPCVPEGHALRLGWCALPRHETALSRVRCAGHIGLWQHKDVWQVAMLRTQAAGRAPLPQGGKSPGQGAPQSVLKLDGVIGMQAEPLISHTVNGRLGGSMPHSCRFAGRSHLDAGGVSGLSHREAAAQ
jgi:hypothetical protein